MEYLKIKEVAETFGKHPKTIEKMCRKGKIKNVFKFGREWVISRDALNEYIKSRTVS